MFDFDTIKFSLSGETNSVYMTFEKDHNKKDDKGEYIARYLNFLFLNHEWEDFQNYHFSKTYTDISHRLESVGDWCLYYDIEFPRNSHGVMNVKYQKFYLPTQVRKIIARYLRYNLYVFQKYAADTYSRSDTLKERVYLVVPPERFKLLCKRYGQGKGTVKVSMTPKTKEKLVEAIRKENALKANKFYEHTNGKRYPIRDHSPRLSLNVLAGLIRAAKNTTFSFKDKAALFLHFDTNDDKYCSFSYESPNGKRISYGAIVNHGSDDKPDWSYHT